ncbi:serine hydrolase FSH [Aspergillus californicus]
MPPSTPKNPLPRIACFHGAGSNAEIFEIQCSFLSSLLADTITLEFFNGPFPRAAGPGVLPAFADYGPYKSWFDYGTGPPDHHHGDGSGYDSVGRDGVERAWRMMAERSGPGKGEWVGVMGFSQGTRVAGGLLLDQQRRDALGLGSGGLGNEVWPRVKFGVLCMGGGAPMESEVAYKFNESDNVVEIPTLHLHGLKDEFLKNGREQRARYYEEEQTTLYEINYHHAMPWVKAESEELARLIKDIYKRTKD